MNSRFKSSKLKSLALLFIFILSFITCNLKIAFTPHLALAFPGPTGRCTSSDPDTCYKDKFKENVDNWVNAVYDTEDMNLQSYVHEVYQNLIMSILETIAGNVDGIGGLVDSETVTKKLKDLISSSSLPEFQQKSANLAKNYGAIGLLSQLNSSLYSNQPASTAQYIAYLKDNSLVTPANAQGATYNGLKGTVFQKLWQASRDLTYALFVVAFIAMGFAIMFRIKLSPQSVVTLQSALPRMALTLLLITFSFAIAGLVIDLTNVAGYLLGNLIETMVGGTPMRLMMFAQYTAINTASTGPWGFLTSIWNLVTGGIHSVGDFYGLTYNMSAPFVPILWSVAALLTPILITIMVVTLVLAIPSGGTIVAISAAATIIILLLVLIFILWILFKIFLTLAKAYLGIVITLITGPFQILAGILPGNPGFGGWIRQLLANAAVFPTVFVMFLLSWVFFVYSLNTGWAPPFFINSTAAWLTTGMITSALCSFGIFIMTPKAADIIKAMIENKPFPYGTAMGDAFGGMRNLRPYAADTIEAGQGYFQDRSDMIAAGRSPADASQAAARGARNYVADEWFKTLKAQVRGATKK